jgi:hypothetical protein
VNKVGSEYRPAAVRSAGGLRDLKPELEQFAVDAWRSPKRVLDIHPPDQHTQIGLDLWPPSPSARLSRLILDPALMLRPRRVGLTCGLDSVPAHAIGAYLRADDPANLVRRAQCVRSAIVAILVLPQDAAGR